MGGCDDVLSYRRFGERRCRPCARVRDRQDPGNVSATLNATLKATGDLALITPSYAFATPVLGGQASVGLMGILGTPAPGWSAPRMGRPARRAEAYILRAA
jgi:hypothetical protein